MRRVTEHKCSNRGDNNTFVDINLYDNTWYFSDDVVTDGKHDWEIFYCPFCGDRLREKVLGDADDNRLEETGETE